MPYGELEVEWRLPNREKEVDVRYTYHKRERREKEAVYVAFPLALPGAAVRARYWKHATAAIGSVPRRACGGAMRRVRGGVSAAAGDPLGRVRRPCR